MATAGVMLNQRPLTSPLAGKKSRQSISRRQSVLRRSSLENCMGMVDGENQMTVCVRTRPLSQVESARGERGVVHCFCQDKVVRICKEGRQGAVLKSEMGSQFEYQFDKVFGHETTQQEVYEATTRELVFETLTGKNCTVFAYGATGAGKTHTMMGNEMDPGIMPRALVDMFRGIDEQVKQFNMTKTSRESREWKVKLSYLEVYNETIFDLLTENQKPLQPCEDPTDFRVKVLGLTEIQVEDVNQVLDLLQQGNTRRRMESTAANLVSSRSHAVIQVNVECLHLEYPSTPPKNERERMMKRPKKTVTSSTLSLIDLAGSERAASTQNTGARLREGANINRSLLALANCINALSSKKASRVKYRDSKLTHLLKSSLEGNCRLSMIAAINPSHKCYEESHNTLKYANRAKDIKVKSAQTNKRTVPETEESVNMLELVAENQELRERLSMLSGRLSSISEGGDPQHQSCPSLTRVSSLAESFGEDEEMREAQEAWQSPFARKKAIANAWQDSNLDNMQHNAASATSPHADSDLRARLALLEAQNMTLVQLAAKHLNVESKSLAEVVEEATIVALREQAEKIRILTATVEKQKEELERLEQQQQQQQQQSPNQMNDLNLPMKSARSSRRSSVLGFQEQKENHFGRNDENDSKNGIDQPLRRSKRNKGRRESFIPKPPSKKRLSTDGSESQEGPARLKQKVDHSLAPHGSPLRNQADPPATPERFEPLPSPPSSAGTGCLMYPRLRLRKHR